MGTPETIAVNFISSFIFELGKKGGGVIGTAMMSKMTPETVKSQFISTAEKVWLQLTQNHPQYAEPGNQWLIEVFTDAALHHWFWDCYLTGRPLNCEAFKEETAALFRQRFSRDLVKTMADIPELADHLFEAFDATFRIHNPQQATLMALDRVAAAQIDQIIPLLQNILAQLKQPKTTSVPDEPLLWGRFQSRNTLMKAIETGQPIQLLGETQMGKTTMLHWLRHNLPAKMEAKALVCAKNLTLKTPAQLVEFIAADLGKLEWVRPLLGAGDARSATHAFAQLIDYCGGLVLLLDNAHKLAVDGHGFTKEFFDFCSTRTERTGGHNKLIWVSSSNNPLFELFQAKGLTSVFLCNAKTLSLPLLTEADCSALMATEHWREGLLHISGGYPGGLAWLLEEFDEDVGDERIEDAYLDHFSPIFKTWIERVRVQKDVLKKCLVGRPISDFNREERSQLRILGTQGLLAEAGDQFCVTGSAWRRFLEQHL